MREEIQCADANGITPSNKADEKNVSSKYPQYLATVFASLSVYALEIAKCPALPVDTHFMITPLGNAIGFIVSGFCCDEFGSKRAIQISAFPLFMSRLIVAYCRTSYGYSSASLLHGFAGGIALFAAFNYVTEVVERNRRGSSLLVCLLFQTLGKISGNYLEMHVSDFILKALITSVVPVIYLTALSFMPESPVHLCLKEDLPQAKSCLQWLRGPDYDITEEIDHIQQLKHMKPEEKRTRVRQLQVAAFIVALFIFLRTYRLYFDQLIIYPVALYALVLLKSAAFYCADRIKCVKVLQTCFLLMAISVAAMATFIKGPTVAHEHWQNFQWGWTIICVTLWLAASLAIFLLMWNTFDDSPVKNKTISSCLSAYILIYSLLQEVALASADLWILSLVMNLLGFFNTKFFVARLIVPKSPKTKHACEIEA